VIGRADIQTLLDLEAKKEALGCKADEECIVAIAGALGADYVASADIGWLGPATLLAFRVVDVKSAEVLVHANQVVRGDVNLVHAADVVAQETVAALVVRGGSAPTPAPKSFAATPTTVPGAALAPEPDRPASPGHVLGIVAAVVGGVGLAAATGLGVAAQVQTTAGRNAVPSSPVQTRVNGVNGMVTGAVIGWAGGGAIAAAGVTLLVVF
jgi:hypothetical protein